MRLICRSLLLGALPLLIPPMVGAQSVALQGVLGNKALVSLNQTSPGMMSVNQTSQGVTLLAVEGQTATFKIGVQPSFKLKVGQKGGDGKPPPSVAATVAHISATHSPANPPPSVSRVTLRAGADGHYKADGLINNQQVKFLLDTGASTIAMSPNDARRLGINYLSGQKSQGRTASGTVDAYLVTLPQVSVEGITLTNIDAAVVDSNFTENDSMLLGMSFLSKLKITFDQQSMVLEKN